MNWLAHVFLSEPDVEFRLGTTLLGTGTLSTSGGVTTATFTTTAAEPSITITFEAPAIAPAPDAVAFADNQLVGTVSAPRAVTIRNGSGAPLKLDGAGATGDFLVDAGGCMAAIAPGASCSLLVRFAPSEAGTRTGTLTVASNDPAGPLTVALSGTGVTAPAAQPGAKGDPGPPGAEGDAGAILDARAKAEYQRRIQLLDDRIELSEFRRRAGMEGRGDSLHAPEVSGRAGQPRSACVFWHSASSIERPS